MKSFKLVLSFVLALCIMVCSSSVFIAYAMTLEANNSETIGAINEDIRPMAAAYCGGTITNDSIIGFSGETYNIKYNGNQVTLMKGAVSKSGTRNQYSIAFASNLLSMQNCFYQMSDAQINAWLVVRGMAPLISLCVPLEVSFFEGLLRTCGVDLGNQITSTAMLLSQWYNAEIKAKQNYRNF